MHHIRRVAAYDAINDVVSECREGFAWKCVSVKFIFEINLLSSPPCAGFFVVGSEANSWQV